MMAALAAIMAALPIAIGLDAGAELRQLLGLAVVGGLLFSAGDYAFHHTGDLPLS